MSEYEILYSPALYDWISQQPNLVTILRSGINGDKIYSVFNHTSEDETAFKKQLVRRMLSVDIGNNTFETLIDKIEEIQTDQVAYITTQPVTKTNIGTSYVDIYTDFGGRPFFIDTTGFTKMAIQVLWTRVGTGTQTMQIVNHANGEVILESPALTTQSNEFTNVAIPANYLNFKGKWRLQAKSTTAADDPVFAGFALYLRR